MAYATSYATSFPVKQRLPLGYQALERWRVIDIDTSVNTAVRTTGSSYGFCTFDVGEVVTRGFGIVKTAFASTSNDGTITFSVNDGSTSGNLSGALIANGTSLILGHKFDLGIIDYEDVVGIFAYNSTTALQLEWTIATHSLTAGRCVLYIATVNLNDLLANG